MRAPGGNTLWVRHGESTWNRRGLMQGQVSSPPLTALGVEQARRAGARLLRYNAARIISSDLDRAAQTARIIGDRLALPVQYTTLLRERHWGEFEGRPVAEGHREESLLRIDQAVPQGESRNDVADRLRRLVPALTGPGPVVVVTHGDVIREALRMWAPGGRADLPTGNGCFIEISIDDQRPAPVGSAELAERLGPPTAPPDPRMPSSTASLPYGEVPGGTRGPIPGGDLSPEMAHSLIEDAISSVSEGVTVVVTPPHGTLIPKEVGR